MYLKLNNGIIEKYPYSISELRKENPNVSFPKNISAEILASFNIYEVVAVTAPQSTYTNNVSEGEPQLIDGNWTQVWNVTDKPIEEVNAIHEELRANAYREESDPLFFKYQRGEIEQQVWLDKIAEIKARYPKG
jgi:hypothetical protein